MTTDIIDQAGQATREIKLAIRSITIFLQSMDMTCNSAGILNDPGMLRAQIDQARYDLDKVLQKSLTTQWPKAADYAEV